MQERHIPFRNTMVRKPWGCEYLMYENGRVALWCLFIRPGARTSMHCHPHKKTGLVAVSGEVRVSFLNDSITLGAGSKLMIREGLFHSTAAMSDQGVVLIESETPCDKSDLVRLDDDYGREEQPYEGPEAAIPLASDCLHLQLPERGQTQTCVWQGCRLSMERCADRSALVGRPVPETVVVLDGGLVSRNGEQVLGPGDVVSADTLRRLASRFTAPQGVAVLSIRPVRS